MGPFGVGAVRCSHTIVGWVIHLRDAGIVRRVGPVGHLVWSREGSELLDARGETRLHIRAVNARVAGEVRRWLSCERGRAEVWLSARILRRGVVILEVPVLIRVPGEEHRLLPGLVGVPIVAGRFNHMLGIIGALKEERIRDEIELNEESDGLTFIASEGDEETTVGGRSGSRNGEASEG